MNEFHLPRVGASQLKLLERLCNACAVSGDEGEVRAIVLEEIKASADEVKIDALGNVLAIKHGAGDRPRPRVMLAAHMDEIGFMITNDEGEGLFRFETVGGMDTRQLVGKPVWVGKDHVPGVIGAKPIHLTDAEERKRAIALDTLRIDVGPETKQVKVGDRAVYATRFARLGPSLLAKALDNRLGVATLIELFKHIPPAVDLLAAFTVQEEIGARGARVAAYALNPDLAFAIDSTPAFDLPGQTDADGCYLENTVYNTRLGAGPALYVADSSTLSDPRLVRHVIETAETYKIPYQVRQPGGGGTDAGAIHKQRAGIPSMSISIPGRYPHTAVSISRQADWENTLKLMYTVLARLTPEILTVER